MNKKFKDVLLEFFPTLPMHDFKDYAMLELQISRHVLEINLTRAEVLLFEKGFTNGELILDDPAAELNNNNILRSEILNWYLSIPDKYTFLFRKGSITVTHGVVMTMNQYLDFQAGNAIIEDADVVNLSNRAVRINIEFSGCIFKGSINIANSQFGTLVFRRCTFGKGKAHPEPFSHDPIYPSIYANQAKFSGNFELIGFDNSSSKDYKSDFAGPVILTNAVVDKLFFISYIQSAHDIACYFSRFDVVSMWNLKLIFAQMRFLHAEAKELYIQHCTLLGALNDGEEDHKKLAADFLSFKAERFCVRRGSVIIGGFEATGMNISGNIELEESIFVSRAKAGMSSDPDVDDSINLSNSRANVLYFRNGLTSLGRAVSQNVSARSVQLDRSRFINFNQHVYGKSLVMTGSHVANFIDFKPSASSVNPYLFTFQEDVKQYLAEMIPVLPITLNTYPNIKKCIDYCLETTGIFSKLPEIENKIIPEIIACTEREQLRTRQKRSLRFRFKRTSEKNMDATSSADPVTSVKEQQERKRSALIKHYAIFVGEADLSSILVNKKVDFAGALFYGREHDKTSSHYHAQTDHNALNIKYAHVNGDLFINDCEHIEYVPPFKAIGEVDLHSAKVNQFFINPLRGKDGDTDWRATGFKYEYIYSGGTHNARSLDNCDWFKDYLSQDNYLQPYQQLAATFDRMGDDTRAKQVLIRARVRISLQKVFKTLPQKSFFRNLIRETPQLLLYLIISFFAKLGMPAGKAMVAIIVLFVAGALGIHLFAIHGAFVDAQHNTVVVNQYLYSLGNMLPFNISIHDSVVPDYKTSAGNAAATFLLWHKLLSTLFLALLLIGISKITKGDQ